MAQKVGKYTLNLPSKPCINSYAAVVGKKEAQGPLAQHFDYIFEDSTLGQASWEKAESSLQKKALGIALDKASLAASQIDYIFAGDLLNQCTGSSFGLRDMDIPFIGLFGACSTMSLSLATAGVFMDAGAAEYCAAITSSHFCSAERQFRFPLEYGGQRAPAAQWTVTGSGAVILSKFGSGVCISNVTTGKIVDMGIKDQCNMGAAMAPAAACTLTDFFNDTGTTPQAYDLILTGDLGLTGSELLIKLMKKEGFDLSGNHADCGLIIFDRIKQDVHAGGSGCGCSAAVLCSYILNRMTAGELKNVLFVATGALMSPTSVLQGESIPSIAHLVHLTA